MYLVYSTRHTTYSGAVWEARVFEVTGRKDKFRVAIYRDDIQQEDATYFRKEQAAISFANAQIHGDDVRAAIAKQVRTAHGYLTDNQIPVHLRNPKGAR